jgi:predicted transcriptional regulator
MTHDKEFRDADDLIIRYGADVFPPAMPNPLHDTTLTELTAEIVAAYVAHNSVPVAELPTLLRSVYGALAGLGKAEALAPADALVPAVPIKKSVTEEYIICLDDGKLFKSLKRHLAQLGMTPDQYRAKWALPKDYPMVAPAYAKARSELAKSIGLGRKGVR